MAYYENLLKFMRANEVINEGEFETLKYVHSIRNVVYHKGELDESKIDLAILLYYSFIINFFNKLPKSFGLIEISSASGDAQIEFGQGLDSAIDNYEKYYEKAIQFLFTKFSFSNNLDSAVIDILTNQLDRINQGIEFIEEQTKDINFYSVLSRYWYLNDIFGLYEQNGRRPKNLNSILLIYSYIREYKDILDDIESLNARQKKGRRLLRKHRSSNKGKYPYLLNLEKLHKRVVALKGKSVDLVLKSLTDIESKIGYLYSDVEKATSDLDYHIQLMIDIARGK